MIYQKILPINIKYSLETDFDREEIDKISSFFKNIEQSNSSSSESETTMLGISRKIQQYIILSILYKTKLNNTYFLINTKNLAKQLINTKYKISETDIYPEEYRPFAIKIYESLIFLMVPQTQREIEIQDIILNDNFIHINFKVYLSKLLIKTLVALKIMKKSINKTKDQKKTYFSSLETLLSAFCTNPNLHFYLFGSYLSHFPIDKIIEAKISGEDLAEYRLNDILRQIQSLELGDYTIFQNSYIQNLHKLLLYLTKKDYYLPLYYSKHYEHSSKILALKSQRETIDKEKKRSYLEYMAENATKKLRNDYEEKMPSYYSIKSALEQETVRRTELDQVQKRLKEQESVIEHIIKLQRENEPNEEIVSEDDY